MRHRILSAISGIAITALAAAPAFAQAPTSETMALARQLVAKVDPAPQQTLAAMVAPMVGMVQQMGVRQPDRAKALVQEAMMPVLTEHMSDLTDMSAKAYAEVLSVSDLKAVIAFYDTPAGADLIAAQPKLAQLRVQNLSQWMGALQPELQAKIQAVMKSHNWTE